MTAATARASGRMERPGVDITAAGVAALAAVARRDYSQGDLETAARPLGPRLAQERAACRPPAGLALARRVDRSAVAQAAGLNLDRALAASSWFRSGRSTRLRGA